MVNLSDISDEMDVPESTAESLLPDGEAPAAPVASVNPAVGPRRAPLNATGPGQPEQLSWSRYAAVGHTGAPAGWILRGAGDL